MDPRADQPPWGRLIEDARERRGLSQNAAAKQAGLSGTRWRQTVYGEASAGGGLTVPVHGKPETIARMAHVVGVTPQDLASVGREDAAAELSRIFGEQPAGTGEQKNEDPTAQAMLQMARHLEAMNVRLDQLTKEVARLRERQS